MNWSHVYLIFLRELRDQLRDRRTLFTIVVLPLVLYPLLGMVMLQMTQFNREQPVVIKVVGKERWPGQPPFFVDSKIQPEGIDESETRLIDIQFEAPSELTIDQYRARAQNDLRNGLYDLLVVVPEQFDAEFRQLASVVAEKNNEGHSDGKALDSTTASIPVLHIFSNHANDRSALAERRFRGALEHWQMQWLQGQLSNHQLNPKLIDPIRVDDFDISPQSTRSAIVWSKLLPFVMLVWALTGAFYPAIDLCAGEKERGTLETLLSSPADRSEIVWGKLLTVTCFSICTALLNLVSMQVTASMLMRQFARVGAVNVLESLGPLPLSAIGWLVVILLPMSALFSALALAVAALARSSKEGQYYLMPLLLVGMPLVMLPMLPGMKLGVGTCVLPVTGAVLLARAFIEGQYHEAWTHMPFVVFVTAACCMLAVRWAVRQFESESVLFRENERFGLSSWIRHLWRDREMTASPSEAMLCGLIILVALFFGRLLSSDSSLDWPSIARSSLMIQLGMVLAPCLIMATILTRSLRFSLGLSLPRPVDFVVCILLAVSLHPTYTRLVWFLEQEYALGADTKELLKHLDGVITSAPLMSVLMVLAVFPAICEELAFRGFIFGGLKRQNATLRAIIISSVFFGFSHGLLQQSIAATIMGLLLGFIVWKTGGVLCSIAFHVTHNAISMTMPRMIRDETLMPAGLNWAFAKTEAGIDYSNLWLTLSVLVSIVCVAYIATRKPRRENCEEYAQSELDFAPRVPASA